MSYLANAMNFLPSEFAAYVDTLKWVSWKPTMFVLHNTGSPTLAQWLNGGATPAQRMVNLKHYYQGLGWHSAVHWFACPDRIWELCDPTQDGVHCSCCNHVSLSCEMVGDYSTEEFGSGPGAQVRDNAVQLMAVIHRKFGWDPRVFTPWSKGLAFHRECVADHHACPGSRVDKGDMINRVVARMAQLQAA